MVLPGIWHERNGHLDTFFDGVSGVAITMKYNQMNAELTRNENLSDKMTNLKRRLFNI